MDILWAPWRSKYIEGFKDEKTDPNNNPCFVCEALNSNDDKKSLVVYRNKNCFVMMNKYPYNGGHLLIAPNKHIATLEDIDDGTLFEMMKTVNLSINALKNLSNPHGFNIGMNIGRVAGAGLPGHLHIHIVPRWNGDTSFISAISDTKVISQTLQETQVALSEIFKKLISNNK